MIERVAGPLFGGQPLVGDHGADHLAVDLDPRREQRHARRSASDPASTHVRGTPGNEVVGRPLGRGDELLVPGAEQQVGAEPAEGGLALGGPPGPSDQVDEAA